MQGNTSQSPNGAALTAARASARKICAIVLTVTWCSCAQQHMGLPCEECSALHQRAASCIDLQTGECVTKGAGSALELMGAVRAARAVDRAGRGVVTGIDMAGAAFCRTAVLGDLGISATPGRERLHMHIQLGTLKRRSSRIGTRRMRGNGLLQILAQSVML